MQAFLNINTLFKNTEYKIDTQNNLELTELSVTGMRVRTIALSSLEAAQGNNVPWYLSWSTLFLGCALMIIALSSSNEFHLIQRNLTSILMFLTCATVAAFFVCKPTKITIYRDSFSNNEIFKLADDAINNQAVSQFVTDLNTAIDEAKLIESNLINLNPNAKKEYEIHNKHVDDLFNSGLIDEALYTRICTSMHEKVFGKSLDQYTIEDNVIYLNQ